MKSSNGNWATEIFKSAANMDMPSSDQDIKTRNTVSENIVF